MPSLPSRQMGGSANSERDVIELVRTLLTPPVRSTRVPDGRRHPSRGGCVRGRFGVRPRSNRPNLARGIRSAAMRAATIVDGELQVEEHPNPAPGTGELLVRVRAAGVNGGGVHQVRGRYPAPPGWPQDIPGMELAGEVAAPGPGAERFAEGERVMAVVGGGSQAELAVVHERLLMPVPRDLDWPAAGGLPEVFTTAHDALFT